MSITIIKASRYLELCVERFTAQNYGYRKDTAVWLIFQLYTFAFGYQRLKNLIAKIIVQNTNIAIISVNGYDYISLTDLARHKSDEPNAVIANWMRNRNTIEYPGIWEQLYNPDFKLTEFEGFRMQAGLNAFTLSPKKKMD